MYKINENETVNRYGYIVSKKEVYEKYLQNEIMDVSKIITDDFLEIETDNTCFIRHNKIKFVSQKEFLEQIKITKKVCKENNVKIKNINKLSKNIKENYDNYIKAYEQYDKIYNDLCTIWKDYDIRMGYSDDFYYQEVVQKLNFSLDYAKNKKIYAVYQGYKDLIELATKANDSYSNLISMSVSSLDILTKI